MRELIEYIANWVVDDPEAMRVEERQRNDRVVIHLEAGPQDMGRLIGREGRTANAMRTLLKVAANMRDRTASLEIR